MTEEENIDLEPDEPSIVSSSGKKARSALSKIRRDINEDEISSPGALKLLLDKLDNLEFQVAELTDYRDSFYEADKNVAVLKTKLTKNSASDILYSFSLSIGAVLLGLAPSVWKTQPFGVISLVIGGLLVLAAIIFRVKDK